MREEERRRWKTSAGPGEHTEGDVAGEFFRTAEGTNGSSSDWRSRSPCSVLAFGWALKPRQLPSQQFIFGDNQTMRMFVFWLAVFGPKARLAFLGCMWSLLYAVSR